MAINLFDLSGRTALVTGGSKGLGLAMARALAQAGANVVIAARHADELERALVSIVEGTGARGAWLAADMADATRSRAWPRARASRSAARSTSWSTTPASIASRPSSRWTMPTGTTWSPSTWPPR